MLLMLLFSEDMADISKKCSVIGWNSSAYIYAYAKNANNKTYANMFSLDTIAS